MAVKPEDIERLEQILERHRAAGDPVAITIGMDPVPRQKPPIISLTRKINGKEVGLVVRALEVSSDGPEIYAQKLKLELTRADCGIQCRVVTFEPPALFRESGIFLSVPLGKGRQRFRTPALQPFDPIVAFDGSPAARKTIKELRTLGVSFR